MQSRGRVLLQLGLAMLAPIVVYFFVERYFSQIDGLNYATFIYMIIAVAILGFVASCTQQQSSESVPEDVEEISIDPTDIPEKADISEWIKEVRLIPL